jgi:heptosyltransferase-2
MVTLTPWKRFLLYLAKPLVFLTAKTWFRPWPLVVPLDRTFCGRLLVLHFHLLGDVCMALPAFASLRKALPRAHLDILVAPYNIDLLQPFSWFDNLLPLNAPWVLGKGLRSWRETWSVIRRLRQRKYDAVIDFRGDLRHIFLMTLAGIPVRLGYAAGGENLLSRSFSLPAPESHQSRYYTKIIEELDLEVQPYPRWNSAWEDTARSAVKLGDLRTLVLCLHIGTTKEDKKWPYWADFVRHCLKFPEVTIYLSRGRFDADPLVQLGLQNKKRVYAVEFCDFRKTLNFLSRVNLLVSVDSGIAHLAALTDTPRHVLFGPSSPQRTLPRGTAVSFSWAEKSRRMDDLTVPIVARDLAASHETFCFIGQLV